MRKYETMLIARSDLEEERLRALIDEISAIISREGGRVTGVDVWGVRRLEFPIKHEQSGVYAVIEFESGAGAVKELERVAGIKDEVLRAKTLVREGA